MTINIVVMLLASKRRKHLSPRQLHRMDFGSSAKKIGISFPEALRDKLRKRWLKLK